MDPNWKRLAEVLKEGERRRKENEIRLDERKKIERERAERLARQSARSKDTLIQRIEELEKEVLRTNRDRRLKETTRQMQLNEREAEMNELYFELARRLIEIRDNWVIAYLRSKNVLPFIK